MRGGKKKSLRVKIKTGRSFTEGCRGLGCCGQSVPAPLGRSCSLSLFPCSGGGSPGESGGRSPSCPSSCSPSGAGRAFPLPFPLTSSCPALRGLAVPGCGWDGAARPTSPRGHPCGPRQHLDSCTSHTHQERCRRHPADTAESRAAAPGNFLPMEEHSGLGSSGCCTHETQRRN